MTTIRRLRLGESSLYRRVRLQSLKEAPYAFSATYEGALERTDESWDTQADKAAEGSTQAIFIAFRENEPIGISAIYKNKENMEEAEVFQVWVEPESRGTGIGYEIMDTLLEWAEDVGCERVIATVANTNKKALDFYFRCGFDNLSESDGETKMVKAINSNKASLTTPAAAPPPRENSALENK